MKSNFTSSFIYGNVFWILEKETATHSSIHAWKIPWTKEPGGLQSMESQRVGHDWATSVCVYVFLDIVLRNLFHVHQNISYIFFHKIYGF